MNRLTTFEFNPETKEVKEADWKKGGTFISFDGATGETINSTSYYIDKKEGFEYFTALNLSNAKRKAKKFPHGVRG